MMTNVISVTAYSANDLEFSLLSFSPPEVALAEYFCPDVHPPVKTLMIEAVTKDGHRIKLRLSNGHIEATVVSC